VYNINAHAKYVVEMQNKKDGTKGHFNWKISDIRMFWMHAKFVKKENIIVVYNINGII